ncbi:flagellar biosynthesis protein FliQ [Kistimonas scapharcae]|uniref:Flagellar biosynthetic protein FliQ n=1 Tax=Kistimonas scapharcae TaxID=1036133 RepID=A0ABP8V2V6_9GAMM
MTPEMVVDLFRDALYQIVIFVSVIILPSLLVGLLVSIFQAATQINEQTLSFLPRLLVTLVTVALAGHWLLREFMELFRRFYDIIPEMIF